MRGVQTALELKTRLDEMGLRNSIGVTTGHGFLRGRWATCNGASTPSSGMWSILARLMMASTNDILCDLPTYEATRNSRQFEALWEIFVKGKTEPIPVF